MTRCFPENCVLATLRVLALGGCLTVSEVGLFSQDFHVKGEVEYQHYSTVYTREFEFSVKGTAWQGVIERKLPDSVASGPVTLPNGKVMSGPPLNGRVPGEKIFENRSELTIMGAESLVEHYQYYRQIGRAHV